MAKKNPSYQQAVSEIEEIIIELESDDFDVDLLTSKVKRVAELIKYCKNKLHKTEADVQKILDEMDMPDEME